MNRVILFFKSKNFIILLFHVGVLVFNWPLLSLASNKSDTSIFSYIIISWTIIVALLIVIGQCIQYHHESDKED